MTVYVDKAKHPFGRMVMCHLVADTPEELGAMVDKIGVRRTWFQNKGSIPHFDICLAKRKLAVAAGARELDRRDFVEACRRIRATWPQYGTGEWVNPR